MRNLKLSIQYDGSKYKGWQKQKEGVLTIQGKLESVLSKMTGEDIQLIGCGRTDSGVHAYDYTANFHTESNLSVDKMLDYIYKFLPEDIVVKSIKDTSDRFHARYNAKSKTYIYSINNNRFRDVFERKYVYHIDKKLDVEEMKKAAEILIGTHDFKSFTRLKSSNKSTVKTINYIDISEDNGLILIEINGNAFLLNMVRIITGVLIEAGLHNITSYDVELILDRKQRDQTIPIAPPKGLCLKSVQY